MKLIRRDHPHREGHSVYFIECHDFECPNNSAFSKIWDTHEIPDYILADMLSHELRRRRGSKGPTLTFTFNGIQGTS